MTPLLYGLGGVCVRRRWIVLATWLVIFAALAVAARSVGPELNDNLTLPGTDSQQATDLLSDRFPSQANGTNPVVLTAPSGAKLTDAKYKKPIDDTVAAFKRDPDVRAATSPLASKDILAKDGRTGYIALNLRASPSDLTTDDAQRIVDEADPARDAGLAVGFGGYVGQKVSKPETHSSEAVGLAMAVIVLLLTFGTVVAMGLPIVTAIVGLVSGLSIITLISQVAEVPTVAPTLATMIGLGVGIDYALFIVTRHQAQRRAGMETRESIARATATSGGAVVFAGTTVMVALLSLAVVDIPLVTTLGYTSALVVLVAVAAAVTLLPAILAIVGDRIDSLALPHRREREGRPPARVGALGAVRRPPPAPVRRSSPPRCSSRSRCRRSTSTSASRTTARCRPTPRRAAPTTASPRAFGVGANGPLLVSVDMSEQPAKPDQAKLDDLNQQESEQKAEARQKAEAQGAAAVGADPQVKQIEDKASRSASSCRTRRPTRG